MTPTFQRKFKSEFRGQGLHPSPFWQVCLLHCSKDPEGQGSLASEHIQKLRYSMKSRERYRENTDMAMQLRKEYCKNRLG